MSIVNKENSSPLCLKAPIPLGWNLNLECRFVPERALIERHSDIPHEFNQIEHSTDLFAESLEGPVQGLNIRALTGAKNALKSLYDFVKQHGNTEEAKERANSFLFDLEQWFIFKLPLEFPSMLSRLERLYKNGDPQRQIEAYYELKSLEHFLQELKCYIPELEQSLNKHFSSKPDVMDDMASVKKQLPKWLGWARKALSGKSIKDISLPNGPTSPRLKRALEILRAEDFQPRADTLEERKIRSQVIKEAPKGLLSRFFDWITPENWSDRVKRVVRCVFFSMQIADHTVKTYQYAKRSIATLPQPKLSENQLKIIDAEASFIGTILSDKANILGKKGTLEKLSKRYPATLKTLLEITKKPAKKDIHQILRQYRQDRTQELLKEGSQTVKKDSSSVGELHAVVELCTTSDFTPTHIQMEQAIVDEFGGGYYDKEFREIVPNKPSLILKVFTCTKSFFNQRIGNIFPQGIRLGFNTANNYKSLINDAKTISTKFIMGCKKISREVGGNTNFGPGNRFVIKTEESLKKKISRDSRLEGITVQQATQRVGDALRGMIIVDTEEQLQTVTKKINEWVQYEGGEVTWRNMFQEERKDGGYVSIHGRILFPFFNDKGKRRQIRCELQVHFRSIADGSLSTPKERTHNLYKIINETKNQRHLFLSTVVSKLAFLAGMLSIGDKCMSPKELINLCQKPRSIDLCEDPGPVARVCEGNLGIPRHLMPQPGSVLSSFLKKKEREGIKIEKRSIPANQLTPVQSDLNREKVDELIDSFAHGTFNPCENPVLVSFQNRDGKKYVINGHHRYAACSLVGGSQKIIAIYDYVEKLILELAFFPGVRTSDLRSAATEKHGGLNDKN